MSVSGTQSKACCSLPPVQADYTPTGSYTEIQGLKTYEAGPADSKKAILMIMDIFGLSPQILQGADLLASQGFRIIMPDILKGDSATREMFSGTPEANSKKEAWFSKFPGAIPTQAKPVANLIEELSKKYESLGVVGYCWGYKVIVMSLGEGSKGELKAMAGCHPSFAAKDDVKNITIPTCLQPSKDEDMEVMKAIYQTLEEKNKGQNELYHFDKSPHGYMAARANLKEESEREAFHQGYTNLVEFFKKYL